MKKKITLIILILLAILIPLGVTTEIRFINYKDVKQVHYHANVAIFINGQKFDLAQQKYMEKEELCTLTTDKPKDPIGRAHMHDLIPDVVHIEDEAVLWAHYLTNIHFAVGKDYLILDDGTEYRSNDVKKVSFILNGKIVEDPSNIIIGDLDRLLINYGMESQDDLLNTRFKEVKDTAKEYDNKNDPATCSGNIEKADFWTKLKFSLIGQ